MKYDASNKWTAAYHAKEISYPAEGVIRIFKGKFPDLIMPKEFAGKKILDVGCGDGRHFALFASLGLAVSGVEISDEICTGLRAAMAALEIPTDIRTGTAASLPYEEGTFDYLLTWNSCYYMSANGADFQDHVAEMARVTKPGGWIVASIPKKTSFIFKDTVESDKGYRQIENDYFGVRNGEVMRCMDSREDVVRSFSGHFTDFCHADIDMEWFGLPYHWHVFCARRI